MDAMRKIGILALGLALLFCAGQDALAGTTGKIRGTVRDDAGNPLPGANVVLAETRQGATADADGVYFILSVPSGRYSVTGSLIGYNSQTQTDVSVTVDFTTTIDFNLKETSLELAEMTVVASRPPVEPDRTTSKYILDSQAIEKLSGVNDTRQLLSLQAGVGSTLR